MKLPNLGLAIILMWCANSFAFDCYVVSSKDGVNQIDYKVNWGRRSNGINGALLTIYNHLGKPNRELEFADYNECSGNSSGFKCFKRSFDDSEEISVAKIDDDYVVTAGTSQNKAPMTYILKNKKCSIFGGQF